VPGFVRLVIEHVGTGPRGGDLVSVASIQQDYVASYREAVFVGEDGKVYVRPAEVRDIQAFARIWDRNLKTQGFVDAAKNGTETD
jgi:hypothetical protein